MEETPNTDHHNSTKRNKIRFLCRYTETDSLRHQTIKKYSLAQLRFNRRQQVKEMTQFLKNQQSSLKYLRKVKLYLYATSYPSGIPSLMAQIGKSLRRLPHLQLSFARFFFLKRDVPSIGFHIGRNLQKLKYLGLGFEAKKQVTDKGMKIIMKPIGKKLKSLEGLRLNLLQANLSYQGVELLANQIETRLPKLKFLDLKFDKCRGVSVYSLAKGIKNRLKSLHFLNIHSENFSRFDFGCFPFLLENCKVFKSLGISFVGCREVTSKGILQFATWMGDVFGRVKHLDLDFSGCTSIVGSKGLKQLARELTYQRICIQSFSLKFDGCSKIFSHGFRELVTIFQDNYKEVFGEGGKYLKENFKLLHRLALSFRDCDFTDDAFKTLWSAIRLNLRSLRDLDLNFSGSRITFKGIQDLALPTGSSPKNLRSLSLDFTRIDSRSSEGLQALMILLGTISHELQHLDLKFSNDWPSLYPPTNEAMIALVTDIATRFKDLETLRLETLCCDIRDDGLKIIIDQLAKNLPKLQILSFVTPHCDNVTDQGFQDFVKALARTMPQLKKLELRINHCRNITKDGFVVLFKEVETNLRFLKQIRLEFSKCPNWTKDVEELAIETAKRLQKRSRFCTLIFKPS